MTNKDTSNGRPPLPKWDEERERLKQMRQEREMLDRVLSNSDNELKPSTKSSHNEESSLPPLMEEDVRRTQTNEPSKKTDNAPTKERVREPFINIPINHLVNIAVVCFIGGSVLFVVTRNTGPSKQIEEGRVSESKPSPNTNKQPVAETPSPVIAVVPKPEIVQAPVESISPSLPLNVETPVNKEVPPRKEKPRIVQKTQQEAPLKIPEQATPKQVVPMHDTKPAEIVTNIAKEPAVQEDCVFRHSRGPLSIPSRCRTHVFIPTENPKWVITNIPQIARIHGKYEMFESPGYGILCQTIKPDGEKYALDDCESVLKTIVHGQKLYMMTYSPLTVTRREIE